MWEKLKSLLPSNWPQLLGAIIFSLACSLAGYLGYAHINPPPLPPPIWQDQFGWHANPQAVQEVLDRLPFKCLAETPAGQVGDDVPKQVFLWQAYKKIAGVNPPAKNQGGIGSCVSFGTNNAIARTMAVQISINHANEEFKDIAEEATYGGSRVQVGKGVIHGDGSVGAWASKFVHDFGVVSREKHGTHDLTTYSVPLCRKWGSSGVPADLIGEVKNHPVKEITLVKSWDQAKKALASGYGISICSNVGFETKRDVNGVKAPRGNWPHCMCLDGYVVTALGEFGHLENSWGEKPDEGPVGWGEPSTAGFWVESKVIEQMLRAGDSWVFSAVKGFPARKLDWIVRHHAAEIKESRNALLNAGGIRLHGHGLRQVQVQWRRAGHDSALDLVFLVN